MWAMKRISAAIALATVSLFHAAPAEMLGKKPRIVVLTDITNEPDDAMSLVRFLTYTDLFDLEGLIATTSCWKRDRPAVDAIHEVLDAYEKVQENLSLHSPDYPTAERLRSLTLSGVEGYGMEPAAKQLDNIAVNHIIAVLDKPDPRPVWFSVWGGGNTLGAAVMKLQNERPSEAARLVAKIRGYEIAIQDDAFAYIAKSFPDTKLISAEKLWRGISRTTEKFGRWPEARGNDDRLFDAAWISKNVQNGHGALGAVYPNAEYLWEGDTPSFLYLIPNGLHFPEEVDFGGWGGRFAAQRKKNVRSGTGGAAVDDLLDKHLDYYLYSDARDKWTYEGTSYNNEYATIFRWRKDVQNDFAARIDRCVKPYAEVNHPPRAGVNGDTSRELVEIDASPGSVITLDSSASSDPDGDALSTEWIYYPEPGNYSGQISVDSDGTLLVPEAEPGTRFHVILKVSDDGEPSLCAYRRIIVTVK